MARLAVTSAGGEITVKKILPAGISYAGGDPTPTQIDQGADGMTVLTWRVGSLGLGARWTATVLLKGTKVGEWATDAESVVTMDDFRGVPTTINISPSPCESSLRMPLRSPRSRTGLRSLPRAKRSRSPTNQAIRTGR